MTVRFEHLDLVTVTGNYSLLDGSAAAGTVSFTPSTIISDLVANRVVFPVALTVTLDVNGAFSIDLPATDDPDLTPQGWTYSVTERITGSTGRTFSLAVPLGSGPLAMASAAPIASSTGVSGPYLTNGRVAALEIAFGG